MSGDHCCTFMWWHKVEGVNCLLQKTDRKLTETATTLSAAVTQRHESAVVLPSIWKKENKWEYAKLWHDSLNMAAETLTITYEVRSLWPSTVYHTVQNWKHKRNGLPLENSLYTFAYNKHNTPHLNVYLCNLPMMGSQGRQIPTNLLNWGLLLWMLIRRGIHCIHYCLITVRQ